MICNTVVDVTIRRKFRHRHKNNHHVKIEAEIRVSCHKPRNTKDSQQPPEARRNKKEFFLRVFGGSMAQQTPWFWTSSLQDDERIHFCCLEPPSFWYFVMAGLQN